MTFLTRVVSIFVVLGLLAGGVLIAGKINTPQTPIAGKAKNTSQTPLPTSITTPLLTEEDQSPFVAIAEQVKPAVVFINTETVVDYPQGINPFYDFFHNPDRTIPGQGSGFVVDSTGYIITNNHVIENAKQITVTLNEERDYTADIVGQDPKTDIAILKINTSEPLPYLKFGDSQTIQVGDWAIAVGNPFGLDRTVTVGVISAKGRNNLDIMGGGPLYQNFIQTDASINFGNSGGPLVNIYGEVIGINTAINSSGQGIGFAIPANLAKRVVEQLILSGKVTRGFLGVLPQEITPDIMQYFGLSEAKGVLIGEVEFNSPAAKGGVQAGDIIVEFDDQSVVNVPQFRLLVADTKVGKEVSVVVLRDQKRKKLTITIGEMPEESVAKTPPQPPSNHDIFGLRVVELSDELRRRYGVEDMEGVIVTQVTRNSPAEEAGIRVGDVIREINGIVVTNIEKYDEITSKTTSGKKTWLVLIKRNDRSSFIPITTTHNK